ncbi:elongation factor P--(R)-beta-lysine ligase [Coxiella endosymbiont of Amblyomma americanum]|uniref:elongation factor P--(R)-beta-lysine ligase n=1 Tax=Coxiella endosymbiont of Amblyomma americanum TaxID=325775 RepID=UPI00057D8264|nr:elongation factor P--(R)-beta-lysine ligase [Coxiella endosymbiont of Amblyomma americanum]AJC50193.1 poxB regulator PoxA [Coxiella endosymbiont of Amblyomma americanum]AUJ58554.1 EF-P lysine aminoacylase GenX [Coxiella-like endosymbiont of Amblyomma americanum]
MFKKNWRPIASLNNLRWRAKLYADVRKFFSERGVLEVETPLLSKYTVTDINIESFQTTYYNKKETHQYYLQPSPEYAMKRLLASGIGPIYQICKAMRNGEYGSRHNPEFTLLEWYRPNFSYQDLMDEMDALLQFTLQTKPSVRKTYVALFLEYLAIHPFQISLKKLQSLSRQFLLEKTDHYRDRDTLLQILFIHVIEPQIGFKRPVFVYEFPASQAALAKIHPQNSSVSLRFEVYIEGIECANGFEELIDVQEQYRRFKQDIVSRQKQKLSQIEIDYRLLAALEFGMPACSGVALGLDRLLMINTKTKKIRDVLSFPMDIA